MECVTFNSKDVQAVMSGQATRGQIIAVMTSQTCGEACWHAREEICRCSCGGRNHGCLSHGGTAPERTAKIDGHRYRLIAVGLCADLAKQAAKINLEAGYKHVEAPFRTQDGEWVQYKYTWRETDFGAPARLKSASASQMNWKELSGWKRNSWEPGAYLLWERIEKPVPATGVIDCDTGLLSANQMPSK